MIIKINADPVSAGTAAADLAVLKLNEAIESNREARLVVSTGSSQFELFKSLISRNVDWKKVDVFHLDEYIGLPVTHKASFRKYLYERFINHIEVRRFYPVEVEGDISRKIEELSLELTRKPVDVGLIGIGVNGHIAFNDPPADFDTQDPYIIVNLDDRCKMQQVNEGWFNSADEVPSRAVSMSVWQIMQCKTIISCVPHKVKSEAVAKSLILKLTNTLPATMLKYHADYNLFLDHDSASDIITF